MRSAFLCLFGHRPSWRLGVSCVQDEVHRLWQMLGVPAPSHQHQQPHLQQLSPSSTLPPARMFASDLAAAIAFLSPRLIAAGHPPSSSSSSSGFASIPSNLPHPPAAAVAGTEGRKTPDPRSRPSLLQRASDYSVVKSAPGRSSSVFQRRGSTLEQQHSSSSTRSSHLHPEVQSFIDLYPLHLPLFFYAFVCAFPSAHFSLFIRRRSGSRSTNGLKLFKATQTETGTAALTMVAATAAECYHVLLRLQRC